MRHKPLSLRSARMIWIVSLVFAVMVVCFAEFLGGTPENEFGWSQWSVAALGIWSAWSGYSIRRKLTTRALAARGVSGEFPAQC
jgi:hypothetical protein